MRFRTHLISSLATGIMLYPRQPTAIAAVTLAGTLIDLDHLLIYIFQTGDWSLVGALRYNRYRNRIAGRGDHRPRYGSLRSWVHRPELLLPPLWALAARYALFRPIAVGLSLHLLLDHLGAPLRFTTTLLAQESCERCGRAEQRLIIYRISGWHYGAICHRCARRALVGRHAEASA